MDAARELCASSALGLEALERFVAREPLRRVHECVFGVLALESEPVDPRLLPIRLPQAKQELRGRREAGVQLDCLLQIDSCRHQIACSRLRDGKVEPNELRAAILG
jgi:hypothetical protein